jgi:hypothetical protein
MSIFGSWICVTNGSGFNSHLADTRKPEASTASRCSNLDKLLLPDHAGETERMFIFDAISTHAAPGLLGSDSN